MTRLFAQRHFRLSEFDLAPLAFEMGCEWEEGELLLDRVVSRSAGQPGVVALAAPTAGEPHATIERHLNVKGRLPAVQKPDAGDDLLDALAELRRSLG